METDESITFNKCLFEKNWAKMIFFSLMRLTCKSFVAAKTNIVASFWYFTIITIIAADTVSSLLFGLFKLKQILCCCYFLVYCMHFFLAEFDHFKWKHCMWILFDNSEKVDSWRGGMKLNARKWQRVREKERVTQREREACTALRKKN